MRTLSLIGIGSGSPAYLTQAAIQAINSADLLLIPRKGEEKTELTDLRLAICAEVLTNPATRLVAFDMPERARETTDYFGAVESWHDAIAEVWRQEITAHCGDNSRVALLIWGDPSLYDSSLRIAVRLSEFASIQVIPGITAIQALCAAHTIPLNEIGEPVLVTTGRRLRERGWPADSETVAVMLDGGTAFEALDPEGIYIWWGAYLGMKHEILASGALAEMRHEIVATRKEARARHGWIMDTYLLKRNRTV